MDNRGVGFSWQCFILINTEWSISKIISVKGNKGYHIALNSFSLTINDLFPFKQLQ
jgi:hypothetical protein